MASESAFSTRVPGSAVISYLTLHLQRSRGYKAADSRSVAQSGSAPRSGRGGRRFKSCHSDQLHTQGADPSQLSAKPSDFKKPKVHKGVHRRVLRMAKP